LIISTSKLYKFWLILNLFVKVLFDIKKEYSFFQSVKVIDDLFFFMFLIFSISIFSNESFSYKTLSALNSATFWKVLLFHTKNVFNQIHSLFFLASTETSLLDKSSALKALQKIFSAIR
jgi:hypothetical protein